MRGRGGIIIALACTLAAVLAITLALALTAPSTATERGGDAVAGTTDASTSWYFAEGTTRPGFREYICLLNPGEAATDAVVTLMTAAGATYESRQQVPPRGRVTVDVGAVAPAGTDVAAKVESSDPVVAERPVYFTYGGISSGHVAMGVRQPRSAWYFAEGTTRPGYDTYLSILNPNVTEAELRIEYYRGDGSRTEKDGIEVGSRSRLTVAVHEDAMGIGRHDGPAGDVSIRVTSNSVAPVVVERPMYFTYNSYITGGHDVAGAPGPASRWYFAEGCTRSGFDTYLCIGNPGPREAEVQVDYRCADGQVVTKDGIHVAPRSRFTIPVHDDALGVGRYDDAHGEFGIEVSSDEDTPVVVERPCYFSYRPYWTGGHDVLGAIAPAERWYFAEGTTRYGYDTYLCVMNTGDRQALVNITYCRSGAEPLVMRDIAIAAESRLTVPVHGPAPGMGRSDDALGDAGIMVETVGDTPVVAERTIYFAEKWMTMDRTALALGWPGGQASRGNAGKNNVAFTFDIEGSGPLTNQILDILAARNVKATFFILGSFARSHPDIVLRMAREGHELANHSASHPWFTKISADAVTAQLAAADDAVKAATGLSTKPYFRFPNGAMNAGLIKQVNSLGYLSVYWTIDPQEWRPSATAQGVHDTVVSQACNGAIILQHDRPLIPQVLGWEIDDIRARGFVPVTLTETLYPGP